MSAALVSSRRLKAPKRGTTVRSSAGMKAALSSLGNGGYSRANWNVHGLWWGWPILFSMPQRRGSPKIEGSNCVCQLLACV